MKRTRLRWSWCLALFAVVFIANERFVRGQPPASGVVPSVLPAGTRDIVPSVLPAAATDPPAIESPVVFQPYSSDERIRALEDQNRRLQLRLQELAQRQDALSRVMEGPRPPAREAPRGSLGPATVRTPEMEVETVSARTGEARIGNIPQALGRPLQPERDIVQDDGDELSRSRVDLSQGLRFFSPDGRYRIEFHDLTQGEFRDFAATSESPNGLHDSFDISRQRLYFAGQVDRYFDFYTVYNRGYGTFDVLDSFVNFKFDPAFNIRMGRTKTPYTYEYYKISEGDLIAPERSVFVGNLAPNRQIGAMAFGRVLDQEVEYALGIFNGAHHSYQATNDFKSPFLFLNTKPFLNGGSDILRQLNIGGSFNFGRANNALEPNAFHTANDETTTSAVTNVSPTFLQFNPAAIELGSTAFWSGDVAYYYRSLTGLASYDGGWMTYALPKLDGLRVPFEGYSVALTYFLTGEEIITRKEVEPLRNYDYRDFINNPGAWELFARIGTLNAGESIYNYGLVNSKNWARSATVYDIGANWYLNRFVRIFFDYQLGEFSSPVNIGPNRYTNSSNMFWFRTQLYY